MPWLLSLLGRIAIAVGFCGQVLKGVLKQLIRTIELGVADRVLDHEIIEPIPMALHCRQSIGYRMGNSRENNSEIGIPNNSRISFFHNLFS